LRSMMMGRGVLVRLGRAARHPRFESFWGKTKEEDEHARAHTHLWKATRSSSDAMRSSAPWGSAATGASAPGSAIIRERGEGGARARSLPSLLKRGAPSCCVVVLGVEVESMCVRVCRLPGSGVWERGSRRAILVALRRAARAPPTDFAPDTAADSALFFVDGLSFRSGHTVLFNDTNTHACSFKPYD
jgi:hypothetical protein